MTNDLFVIHSPYKWQGNNILYLISCNFKIFTTRVSNPSSCVIENWVLIFFARQSSHSQDEKTLFGFSTQTCRVFILHNGLKSNFKILIPRKNFKNIFLTFDSFIVKVSLYYSKHIKSHVLII